jgi:MFS family permease
MLTGIAVGGSFPLVFSLLGDLYPSSARAGMSAAVQIATGLGIGGGQVGSHDVPAVCLSVLCWSVCLPCCR